MDGCVGDGECGLGMREWLFLFVFFGLRIYLSVMDVDMRASWMYVCIYMSK